MIKKLKLAQQRQSRLVKETNLVKVQSDTSIVVQPPSITAQIPKKRAAGGRSRSAAAGWADSRRLWPSQGSLLNKQEAPTCKSSAWLCFCHCQLASQRCSGQSRENVRLQEPSMALMYTIHSGTEDPQHISVVLFLTTKKEKNHLGVSGSGGGRYMVKWIGTLNVPFIS